MKIISYTDARNGLKAVIDGVVNDADIAVTRSMVLASPRRWWAICRATGLGASTMFTGWSMPRMMTNWP
jgi:hypothetical protein